MAAGRVVLLGMKFIFIFLFGAFSLRSFAAEQMRLDEVMSVIRTNITDLSEEELSRSAAVGLIKELGTKVQLVQSVTTNEPPEPRPAEVIPKTAVYNDKFGYVRIKSVDERLTKEFQKVITQLLATNGLAGVVLDLRYAQGTNYEAAAKVADAFVKGGQPLVRLGDVKIAATDRGPDIRQPVAVLVNGETRAAAEALAGMLRESAAALVIGSKTAGEARLYETFTLSTGQRLRVGKVPIEVGRGKPLPASGIVPDIEVSLAPEEEEAYYEDPYLVRRFAPSSGGTNEVSGLFPRTRPLNEAELVRRHRNAETGEVEERPETVEPSAITDPTLARALDFLKGISVLQPRRSATQ
jgi:C-terminal processing protease CtpA/Prc